MRKWLGYIAIAAVLALLAVAAWLQLPPPLTEADTVAPRLDSRPRWVAGKPGQLEVRLHARLADGGVRDLGFGAEDPVATVTFYRGEEALSPPLTVPLSHRC